MVFNVAYGGNTTLLDLFDCLRENLSKFDPEIAKIEPTFRANRAGDIPHSQASILKAQRVLGYNPKFDARSGFSAAAAFPAGNVVPVQTDGRGSNLACPGQSVLPGRRRENIRMPDGRGTGKTDRFQNIGPPSVRTGSVSDFNNLINILSFLSGVNSFPDPPRESWTERSAECLLPPK